ncbi:MAG: hypothetical protein GC155_17825 [Alphaproteobacteria bacterium]|nr:hypothetical protein [Alphaproteobacteria bacterium]
MRPSLLSSTQFALWFAALLGLAYFLLVIVLAPGGPFGDDLDIAIQVGRAQAAHNPWPILWTQHNEHRLLVTELMFWGQRALMGAPNYTLLAFAGGLFLIPIFLILAQRASRIERGAGAALVFAAAMTFSYSSADSMLWAMAAISNYGVIAFAAAMVWLLNLDTAASRAGALACAILAVASQGNGILAPFLGAAYLVTGRRWGWAALWLAVSIAVAAAYLHGYARPDNLSDPLDSMRHPIGVGLFALVMSGSAFGYPMASVGLRLAVTILSALLGVVLCGLTVFGFMRSRFLTRDPLLWFNAFLLGSILLAALGRLDMGLIQALAPRYHINSCLLAASCVMVAASDGFGAALGALARKTLPALAVGGCLYLAASSLTLWRMHTFYAAHVGERYSPPPAPN